LLEGRAGLSRALLLGSIGVFVGLVYFGGVLPTYLQPGRISLQLLAIALVIKIVSEGRGTATQTVLNAGPVAWVGRLSYSLYLWQQVFCIVIPAGGSNAFR
jgi:peptidoglycan/LPS O-acetylase OafA/YrhL